MQLNNIVKIIIAALMLTASCYADPNIIAIKKNTDEIKDHTRNLTEIDNKLNAANTKLGDNRNPTCTHGENSVIGHLKCISFALFKDKEIKDDPRAMVSIPALILEEIRKLTNDMKSMIDLSVTYTKLKNVNLGAADAYNELGNKLHNFINFGSETKTTNPDAAQIKKAAYNVNLEEGGFSTTNATTLLSTNDAKNGEYSNKQKNAALSLIKNVSGANMGLAVPQKPSTQSSATIENANFKTTLATIQSFANQSLLDAYLARAPLPDDARGKTSSSKRKLLHELNIKPSEDQWNALNKMGIFGRIKFFLDSAFATNYLLQDISDKMERNNILLSMIITQNNMNLQMQGQQLEKEAQNVPIKAPKNRVPLKPWEEVKGK